jgi:DNA repair exonuclease SbcCD ATPase subunit
MTISLFALAGDALSIQRQINEAAELLSSEDPSEVATAVAALERLIDAESDNRQAVERKADAWCWVIDQLRAQAAAQAEHAKRLGELAKATEQQADGLQERLISVLQKLDGDATSWALPEHKITSRRSTAVEVAVAPSALPPRFQKVKMTYSADKTALKAALQAGEAVEGAELVERRSWTIK